jgi:hypothetical protein
MTKPQKVNKILKYQRRGIVRFILRKIRKRLVGKYPPYLNELLKHRPAVDNIKINRNFILNLPLDSCRSNIPDRVEIPLASKNIIITSNPDWKICFEDMEDVFALHRFGWILRNVVENVCKEDALFMWDLMLDWIKHVPIDERNPAWESYSVSERIVNWIFFISVMRNAKLEKLREENTVIESLAEHVDYLLDNLEYHGTHRTNNHLINNGRALYIGGSFLGLDIPIKAGRRILIEEAKNMFTPSGFLKEGSSHYHLLLCRTYLEVLWTAKIIGDQDLSLKLIDKIKEMLEGVKFFLPLDYLPLIGDVSPDFPPEWLKGITHTANYIFHRNIKNTSKGWHSLWVPKVETERRDRENEMGFICHEDAGWYRYMSPKYIIWWHVTADIPCHGHNDIGGFELHWRDKPLFVDTGRATYENSILGRYGKSIMSHSNIMLKEREPFVRSPFPLILRKKYCANVNWEDGRVKRFRLKHNGYGIEISRTFTMDESEIIIEDEIGGKETYMLDTYFHLHPEVLIERASEGEFCLKTNHEIIKLAWDTNKFESVELLKGVPGQFFGWYSHEYGKVLPTTTLRFKQMRKLPVYNRFYIHSG